MVPVVTVPSPVVAAIVPPAQPADVKRPQAPCPAPKKKRAGRAARKPVPVRRIVWSSVIGLVLTVLGVGGFLTWRAYANLHKVFHGTTAVAALTNKPVTPDLLKGEGDGRINVLLLGIGGPDHEGPDLTDTIVLMSVDPVNNTASMLSIPRDLWVKQPVNYFGSVQKINAAYESGKYHYIGKLDPTNNNTNAVQAGFVSADQVISNVLDVKINYHVLVDFQAFRQAIDAVDGVTVDVPTQLYDPTMQWENHNNPVLADVGIQQMDGVKALLYARSRETTSDFARAERQRQILVALKDKVLTAGTLSNPAKIEGLMNAFGNNVYSDLSTQGASRLFSIIKKVSDTQIASLDLTQPPHKLVTTDHVGATSVVRPIAGFDSYADIQTYVHTQLLDGYLLKEHAPVTVVAPTTAGASATSDLLKTYGYNVTATAITTAPFTGPVLVNLSHNKYPFTLHYLEERYGVRAVTTLPAGLTLAPGPVKFVIIVPK